MRAIKIAAVGDVHGFRYINLLLTSLKLVSGSKPDIIIFAGDMIDSGNVKELKAIVDSIRFKYGETPIVSIYGNEEYHEVEGELIREYPDIIWLNDSPAILAIEGIRVGIVGSRGVLEKLTFWQKRNKPELERVYRERPLIIENLLKNIKRDVDLSIYVSHYAPTFITVRGEPEKVLPYMGSKDIEHVLRRTKPDIAIHAHAHNARTLEADIDGVRIYNVSLPARRGITVIEAQPRGLKYFMKTSHGR